MQVLGQDKSTELKAEAQVQYYNGNNVADESIFAFNKNSSTVALKDAKLYCVFHIAVKEFPKYKESQGQIVCFDKLFYNEDGTI